MTTDADPVLGTLVDAVLGDAALYLREGDPGCLQVRGADAIAYLHRMLTQDVAAHRPGQATYACLLTIKGRILGDPLIWIFDDAAWLELDPAALDAAAPVLEKFVIADDVAFEDVTGGRVALTLAGPQAEARLQAAGLPTPAHGHHVALDDGAAAGPRILRFDRRGLPCFELRLDSAAGLQRPAVQALRADVRAIDAHAWAAACVHAGIPRFGPELGDSVLFNEAGLEEAVAWDKGCYPGQEPVVMARHRGHPPRRLVRLDLAGDGLPNAGAAVSSDGAVVGAVTSVAPRAGDRAPTALAYVRYASATAGRAFEIEGGAAGVATLPAV